VIANHLEARIRAGKPSGRSISDPRLLQSAAQAARAAVKTDN
jgi:hypothetical protein